MGSQKCLKNLSANKKQSLNHQWVAKNEIFVGFCVFIANILETKCQIYFFLCDLLKRILNILHVIQIIAEQTKKDSFPFHSFLRLWNVSLGFNLLKIQLKIKLNTEHFKYHLYYSHWKVLPTSNNAHEEKTIFDHKVIWVCGHDEKQIFKEPEFSLSCWNNIFSTDTENFMISE